MAIWNDDLLNKPNGEIDIDYMDLATLKRAQSINDGSLFAERWNESYSFLMNRAGLFRILKRRKLGLPDSDVMIPMPADIAAELAKSGVQWES